MAPYFSAPGIELHHADCLAVLPTLAPGSVDAVITDPPYGIGWSRGTNKARNSKPHDGIQNDDDTTVRDLALGWLAGIPAIVFGSFYAPYPKATKQVLVWHKPADSGLVGSVTGFRRDAEPIFLVGNWPFRTVEFSSVFRSTFGQSATVTETGHPHTKPLELMRRLVECCPDLEKICDPFAGSGTTAIACIQTGRKFIGIQIEEKYCEIAVKRIEHALCQGAGQLPFAEVAQAEFFQEAKR